MAKYKVGDKVRIVSERPKDFAYTDNMGKYLGKTFIVSMVKWHPLFGNLYSLEGAIIERGACAGSSWVFKESWISGLAEPEREPCTVELRFDGMITTAVLKRGGRDVKTAEARCNPKDTYSRAEGARVAVERLFEKKRKEDKPKESKPKMWDKFVVAKEDGKYGHLFNTGEIVTLLKALKNGNLRLVNEAGLVQLLPPSEVRPYKEKSK
jgi:hypothetical protein|nr:MAG TPA: hypothetical protein [Caudoviricetes sp.]DAZ07065.1 MAG TPA: hypothetical protein [Caudoviricetes sp.]